MTKIFSAPWYTIYIARSIPILTILAAWMNVYFCISYCTSSVNSWSNIFRLFLPYLKNNFQSSFTVYDWYEILQSFFILNKNELIIILHVLILLTFLFLFYPHLSATNFFVTTRVIKMTKESSRLNILLRLGTIICQFENAF